MVIGLYSKLSDVDVCLSNLAEADFKPSDISLVMNDHIRRKQLFDVSGPLTDLQLPKLTNTLIKGGVPATETKQYTNNIKTGDIFIAVSSPGTDNTAAEMLTDHHAERVKITADGEAR